MAEFIEFALIAWVAISVVAVVVQLIRIARYKRAARASETAGAMSTVAGDPPTIDLAERTLDERAPRTSADTAGSNSTETAMPAPEPVEATVDAATTAGAVMTAGPSTVAVPAPNGGEATTTPRTLGPAPTSGRAAAEVAADPDASQTPASHAEATPTLADLLAGVRLPWNLLPTVDQSREPSNDRVALITEDGAPGEIGVDVADELERLGFTISPQGEDTALATKEGRTLGLRIIPEPAQEFAREVPRFPNATEDSVALDIWIER